MSPHEIKSRWSRNLMNINTRKRQEIMKKTYWFHLLPSRDPWSRTHRQSWGIHHRKRKQQYLSMLSICGLIKKGFQKDTWKERQGKKEGSLRLKQGKEEEQASSRRRRRWGLPRISSLPFAAESGDVARRLSGFPRDRFESQIRLSLSLSPPSPSCATRDNFPRVAFCVCIPLNIRIYDNLPIELTRKAYHVWLHPLSADSEPLGNLGLISGSIQIQFEPNLEPNLHCPHN